MQATAHPDDENNALHVYLNRGQGVRTILATATRGDGGQNEIGPELNDPLAVLRTEELEAMHRFDATEQYFTRAIDFGYSFSIEETLEKWGRDEIIGDYVRLIRMTRPDVVVGMNPTGTAGGLHHQTSGLLSREAFKAAGDPSRYPDQIRDGLVPWQARKYYYPAGGPGGGRGQTRGAGRRPAAARRAEDGVVRHIGIRSRCSDGRTSRSAPKSAACTRARRWRQLLALPTGRTLQRYLLMDSSRSAASRGCRGRGRGTVALPRHRHDHSGPRVSRRCDASGFACVRASYHRRSRDGRAEAVRRGRPVRRRAFAPGGSQRRTNASPATRDDGAFRRGALQPRCAAEDQGRPVHRSARFWRTGFASKCWRMMASSFRDRTCACRSASAIADGR